MYYYKMLGTILIGAAVSIGLWWIFNKKKRIQLEDQEVLYILTKIRSAIQDRVPLPEAIAMASKNTRIEREAKHLLHAMETCPSSDFYDLWKALWEHLNVSAEDKEYLRNMAEKMNMYDLHTSDPLIQLQCFDRAIRRIEKILQEQEVQWRQQKSVYMRLSVLAGVLIMIILI